MANSNLLRVPASKFSGKVIIYCEGRNTEPSYFKLLKKHCTVEPVPQRGGGVGCCTNFVNTVIKQHENRRDRLKYQHKWIVFDCDGHDDYAQAIQTANAYGFEVAFSNMCIEYWFLLHLIDHDGRPIPLPLQQSHGYHSQSQINMINGEIRRYNSHRTAGQKEIQEYDPGSKTVEEDFFDLLMATNPDSGQSRLADAYFRAKSIHEKKRGTGNEFDESVSTMYKLIDALGIEIVTPEQDFIKQLQQKNSIQNLSLKGDKIYIGNTFVCRVTSTRPNYVIEVANGGKTTFEEQHDCIVYVTNIIKSITTQVIDQ